MAGSVENLSQPTNLSNCIAQLASIESDFNGNLAEAITYKEHFPLYFFGPGWAISDKVYDLRPIQDGE